MALPCFYIPPDNTPGNTPDNTTNTISPGIKMTTMRGSRPGNEELVLNEETSRHIVQVLRMKPGEPLQITDGRGNLLTAVIVDDHKKKCVVRVQSSMFHPIRERKVSIGISLLKNANRFEWFLEKATEIGVTEIIPLLCERTEKQHFRQDRMENILVSAMLQSQQTWLPVLQPPVSFSQVMEIASHDQLFIAHCLEEKKPEEKKPEEKKIPLTAGNTAHSQLILIGPEGDFSSREIELALQHHFSPVTLGETRLRTETAGMVAATLLCIR